ncbi:hypothetical protein [Chitinophaga nivalis]|uniref:Uncharacterized protein n=1 Tax=Chitinophaga nivalis TaxID=2991709 RepID=A0ABT3IJQ9_9BACT|nr:hypothetical protein [Chitinophaga nivalis]MCW3466264.1 hypothetical protein [Chitinophaga nivalis]MCW3484045.1 hypothetical protein [Chitinophaga nivalis]
MITVVANGQEKAKEQAAAENSPPKKIGYEYGTRIKVDLQRAGFTDYSIPFDVPFRVYGDIPKEISKVKLKIINKRDCRKCKDDTIQVADWYRDILHKADDSVAKNTFYFVIPPLKAIRNYSFEFEMQRDATAAESEQISILMRGTIRRNVNDIYNTATNMTDLSARLQDPKDLVMGKLSASMTQQIISYYEAKDITLDTGKIRTTVNTHLNTFIADSLYPLVMQKNVRADNLEHKIEAGKNYYLQEQNNMKTFLTSLVTHKSELGISDELGNSITTALLTDDAWEYRIYGVQQADVPDVFDKQVAATALPDYLKVSADMNQLLQEVTDQLQRIQNNPEQKAVLLNDYSQEDIAVNTALLRKMGAHQHAIYIAMQQYIGAVNELETRFNTINLDLNLRFPIQVNIPGKTTAEFVTRGDWYITADLGVAWVFTSPHTVIRPYFGANFNFFPINRQANYSFIKSLVHPNKLNLLKSLSGVIGVTVVSFSADEEYEDLFNNLSLITALGVRLTDGVRVSGGVMWAYRKDMNPLKTDKSLAAMPYAGLSLDLDLKKWIEKITKNITGFN